MASSWSARGAAASSRSASTEHDSARAGRSRGPYNDRVTHSLLERRLIDVSDRLKRLRAMGVCIRMATAILPVPALKPRDFRLTQLSSLAGLSKFIHHLLVSTGERFLLRLYVLGLGYRIIDPGNAA